MAQVLHPLEVGHRHPAGVDQRVGDHHRPLPGQDLIGFRGGGAVGALGDDARLDAGGVLAGELPFQRRGDQDVAIELQAGGAVGEVPAAGEVEQGAAGAAVSHHRLDVEPDVAGDGPFPLHQPHQNGAPLLEELGGVVAHVAEPLHHHPLSLEPGGEAERLHVLGDVAGFADHIEHPAAGGLDTAADPAVAHRLAGHAAERVELAGAEGGVGIGDPGHLAGAGAHVGGGDVEAGADEVLLDQLEDVAPGDPLQLAGGVGLGGDPHPALGAAEGHIHQGALPGHEGGEGLDLVGVHVGGVADTPLAGELVVAVLGPPGVDHLDRAVVPLDGEGGVIDVAAGPQVREQGGLVLGEPSRAVEAEIHLLEEAGADGHGGRNGRGDSRVLLRGGGLR